MDKEGRIYVGDRSNTAVEVYDQNGKLLHVWHQFGQPSGLAVDKNDLLYAIVGDVDREYKGRDEGRSYHPHQSQTLAGRAHRNA